MVILVKAAGEGAGPPISIDKTAFGPSWDPFCRFEQGLSSAGMGFRKEAAVII